MSTAQKTKQLQHPSSFPAKAQSFAAAFKMTRLMAILAILVTLVVSVVSLFMVYTTMKTAGNKVYFVTERGTMVGELRGTKDAERIYYEARNHVDMFMKSMFAFDESNFEENMEKALKLSGNDGKFLYQAYLEQGTLADLRKTNAVVTLRTDSINVNPYSDPYEAIYYGTQIVRTSVATKEQPLHAFMQLIEVSRNDDNIHGLQIQQFQQLDTE
jgi:hypothetical protein